MNFIDQLALKSAEFTATNLSDNSAIEHVIKKHKNKDVSLNKEDTISVLSYGFQAIYGELFKSIIVLFISLLFHIFIPTLVVMLSFSIVRAFIGGKHLHSSGKCLILTSILLIGSGWIASILSGGLNIWFKILIYIAVGIVLELTSITKPFELMLKKLDGVKT
jgi:accessory gene regulator protein AgrB